MELWIIISGLLLAILIIIPLSVKWNIDKKISVPSACLIGIISGIIVTLIVMFRHLEFIQILILEIFFIGIITISIVLGRFYRDPERIPPGNENAILSPADGKIIYVKKIKKGMIPLSEKNGRKFSLKDFIKTDIIQNGSYLIGIEMSILDVHVNRAPISGKIKLVKHIKGIYISLRKKEAVIQNERVFIAIDNKHFKLGVVQIASRLVRKIVSYFQEGQDIKRGERIGMIKFGSQVDVILPTISNIRIQVSPGDKVIAGITIIANIE